MKIISLLRDSDSFCAIILKKILKFFHKRLIVFAALLQNLPYLYFRIINPRAAKEPPRVFFDHITCGDKVALFAAYQSHSSELLDMTLQELRRSGYKILYVSNLTLSEDFYEWLAQRVDTLMVRRNYGRDFGAYKEGSLYLHDKLSLNNLSSLLFMNDTVIFPLFSADDMWKKFEENPAEIVGIYHSFSPQYHVQSFFFLIRRSLLKKDFFVKFWKNYKITNSRYRTILQGELGFSKAMQAGGATLDALVNHDDFIKSLRDCTPEKFKWIPLVPKPDQHSHALSVITPELIEHCSNQFFIRNPSHYLAFFSLVFLSIPLIKKDVFYKSGFPVDTLYEVFQIHSVGCDYKSLLNDFNKFVEAHRLNFTFTQYILQLLCVC